MAYHWSIHQLTEYFDAVVSADDEFVAVRAAVERAAEALGAEVGALVRDGRVLTCVGVGRGDPPVESLVRAAAGAVAVDVAKLGLLHAAAAPLDGEISGQLVVARVDDEFGAEERQLLRGMASVLGLALRSIRTLQTERRLRTEREREAAERLVLVGSLGRRQRLLESLLAIQKAISHRAPLSTVLDAVTDGVTRIVDGAFVALVLTDDLGGAPRIVSSAPVAADSAVNRRLALDAGPATLVAPVHIEGGPAGILVAVPGAGPTDLDDAPVTLAAFAEQASLALTDARTVEAMQDARHDSLTGLPNRALFLEGLHQALQRAARLTTEVTVLFIDLDRFKDVNDSLGHAAGDGLLEEIAGRLRACLRDGDSAARLGGDEFAVLLEGTTGHDAGRAIAGRISAALLEPVQVGGHEVFALASIGIASSDHSGMTADDLLRNADLAMYAAKRSGSRRAIQFEGSMHAETMPGLELRTDLAHAVARGELRLQYQPLVELTTGVAVAVEALVRWDHPRRGTVPPNVFVPMAERNGLIAEIGAWVLLRGCEQVADWRSGPLPDLRLSVNVSALQLAEPTFPALLSGILLTTGLPAHALTLEITESALMGDPENSLQRLAYLKELGVWLAIDDFGTGFSSLAWLQQFPADQLKIDKAFIDTVATSAEGAAIVRTVVELARTLRLETVAEGIETRRQWDALRELSCDLGQGFHFARPLAADAVPAFFAGSARAGPGGADPAARPGHPVAVPS